MLGWLRRLAPLKSVPSLRSMFRRSRGPLLGTASLARRVDFGQLMLRGARTGVSGGSESSVSRGSLALSQTVEGFGDFRGSCSLELQRLESWLQR